MADLRQEIRRPDNRHSILSDSPYINTPGITRALPPECQACGTWCGDLLQADAICKITGKPGCLLRNDRRFKEAVE